MKVLIKIGSALISRENKIDYDWLEQKVFEISRLADKGYQPIIVTSGAVAAGMQIQGIAKRPKDTLELQMLSGIGQAKLIHSYRNFFRAYDRFIAQVLVTHHNFSNETEVEIVSGVLNGYLERGIVPIINENDLVNKEELEYKKYFTDNDILAALVSVGMRVDLAIILTDVDGLYNGNPKTCEDVEFLDKVYSIDEKIKKMAADGKSDLGLGGMKSKVQAAQMITSKGIKAVIANGNYSLLDIVEGRKRSTTFFPITIDQKA
ncbi:MAG: glutamate 5-kinase [Spirochaetales bacterium]|nr:glutamate 5-kinase [Spirochaetales bacterium]